MVRRTRPGISRFPGAQLRTIVHAPRAPERRRLENRRLADRLAKGGFKKIEVAAFIGLLDVLGEHPAIAALEPRLRLLPLRATLLQLRLGYIEVDGARGDIERYLVAVF